MTGAARTNGTAPVEPDHEVAIIGAGFAGLGAAIKLKKAGIHDFVIAEQSDDVGGTWRDNTYPGVAVDINSFSYSFSFEPNPDWTRVYAKGPELKRYADHLVEKYELRPHIHFKTRVVKGEFDERNHMWRGHLEDGRELTSRFVIAGPGGLTQPKLPDIEGLDDFGGPTMHTARWDHDVDLRGKRVAVIGTGASGVQVIPQIAPTVDSLQVFQRTPIWVLPKPDYRIPRVTKRLFRYVPPTQYAMRLVSGAATEAVMVLGVVYNRQLPQLAKTAERLGRAWIRMQVRDPELREKLTPHYGFGCKRPVVSNDYFPTFNRENVELVTDRIEKITKTGIRTADGELHKVDVLILATGFKVFELGNTPSFPVHGLDGLELGRFWDEQRYQAYEACTMPKFPNLFMLLGPYGLAGSSYMAMIETNARHAVRAIKEARRREATWVAVKQEEHDRYHEQILGRMENAVFFNNNCGSANSYYFDRHGDAPMLRPHSGLEMWWRSSRFNLDHYEYRSVANGAASPKRGRVSDAVAA